MKTQISEFSVVTPQQTKFTKPVDAAILSKIPEGVADLTTYPNELLKTNKPEQQNNTLWFPTPENHSKTEVHSPIQTRFLKELNEKKEEEKLKPTDNVELRKLPERMDWNDTLLTPAEKQAV